MGQACVIRAMWKSRRMIVEDYGTGSRNTCMALPPMTASAAALSSPKALLTADELRVTLFHSFPSSSSGGKKG